MSGRIKARTYAMAGMLMCWLGTPVDAMAVEAPRLSIQTAGKLSGKLNDGQVITQVRVATQEAHMGFQLWSDGVRSGNEPNRYVVAGVQNGRNTLRVRIEKESGRLDGISGKGLIVDTGDDVAYFNIVSDGEQAVVVDNYQLEVRAAVIGSNSSGVRELGEATSQIVSFNFNAEQVLEHELTPTQSVFQNDVKSGEVLASGKVTTVDNSKQRKAVRFTQNSGDDPGLFTLVGKNDASHKLNVRLIASGTGINNGWMVERKADKRLPYTVTVRGNQTVPPDTYVIEIDAVVWGE